MAAAAQQVSDTATAQNPVAVFNTLGLQTVTLTACNALGCSTVSHQVDVIDPRPAIATISVAPAQANMGQQVVLSAQASGQPPLSYSWQILEGSTPVQALSGQTAAWNTTGADVTSYSVQLSVTNASGSAQATSSVTLLAAAVPTHFYTVTPCRLLDTRMLLAPLLAAASSRAVQVAGLCGVPLTARAVAVNVTAVQPSAAGGIELYPADLLTGANTVVDFAAGAVRAASAVLPLSADGLGRLAAVTTQTSGQVQMLIDVSGYFAP